MDYKSRKDIPEQYKWNLSLICADVNAWEKAFAEASGYAEIMARVRKCPATSYLLIAIFPLVPGLGLYHTMEYYISGDSVNFAARGYETLGMAGGLALGIFLVLSLIRMFCGRRKKRRLIDFEEGV